MEDMTKQDTFIWFLRVLTPISVIAALGVQWGIQTTSIHTLENNVGKLDNRVAVLENLATTSTTNAYRLSRLDLSMDTMSKKAADDHDTLVRIDQTVSANTEILTEMKRDIKELSRKN